MNRLGIYIVILWILVAVFASLVSPFDPYQQITERALRAPSFPEIFGRDDLGRDMLSRVIYGARISMTIGLVSETIALLIGIIIGVTSGYFRGGLDEWLMGITDMVLSLPAALLALAIMAIFEHNGAGMIILLLGCFGWPTIARLARAETLKITGLDYISAERALGVGHRRMLIKIILPNIMSPIWVAASVGVAFNILSEAWLSFVGVGVPPPAPSWGWMINEGKDYFVSYPWLSIAPGIAIFTSVFGFVLLGDYLRDYFDVHA